MVGYVWLGLARLGYVRLGLVGVLLGLSDLVKLGEVRVIGCGLVRLAYVMFG